MMTWPERPSPLRAGLAAPCRAGSYQPAGRPNPSRGIEFGPGRDGSGPGRLGVGPDPALAIGDPVVVAAHLLVRLVDDAIDRLANTRRLLAGGQPGAAHVKDDLGGGFREQVRLPLHGEVD